MMFPLVRDLAAEGIPVRLTCGVLGFSPQAFYKWRAKPMCDRDWSDAHVLNAIVDIHGDDPEFGYRFITDELERSDHDVSEGRVHRLCRDNRVWSITTRKGRKGSGKVPGPAVHDDLVKRNFTASHVDEVWLTDITEHPTLEGKLYCCAIKDLCSNRIVGYAIDGRMTAQLAVNRRGPSWSTRIAVRSSGRGRSGQCSQRRASPDRWAGSPPPATTPRWSRSSRSCRRTCSTVGAGRHGSSCATRSSPGSNTPTTTAAANASSASSHPSNTNSPSPPTPTPTWQHDQSQPPSTKLRADPIARYG